MLIEHIFSLDEAADLRLDSSEFKKWFGKSAVVDAHGNPLPVYHGTARPDRVGVRFRKSRATAGPMAYFTDDPIVASNYSVGKQDTSLNDENADYANWFKVKVLGSRNLVDITRAWYFLSSDERARLSRLAPKVTLDDEEIKSDDEVSNGIGNYQYSLKQHRGNVLATLVDGWLEGGTLFGQEVEFLKVLKLAGMFSTVTFDDPNATMSFVYKVYLSIQKPLTSTQIPEIVIQALTKAVSRQPHIPDAAAGWDKKRTNARQWLRNLLDDIESTGGIRSWTVIPDWVTKVLKGCGYDGIHDVGGKNGGGSHSVWIPFDDAQIKSAISNISFDPNSPNIHK